MKGSEPADVSVVITTPVAMETPSNVPKPPKLKSVGDAYVLGIPLGVLGIHHFYLGSPGLGLAYLVTLGCGGIGWVVDWFRMPMLVKDANRKIQREWQIKNEDPACRDENTIRYELDTKRLSDCYVLGFVTGFLGFHQFYLRRPGWGLLYLFSLGMCGIGVLMDWFRMPLLFKRYRTKLKLKSEGKDEGFPDERYLDDAYLCCFPLGLLGFHHFYLRRPCWGILYLFTLGLLGIGFLIDMIRMKSLVDDANQRARAKVERQRLISGGNSAAGVSYTTSPNTVTYNTPLPAGYNNAPPGAPGSYQCPYPGAISPPGAPPAGQPGYPPPPPPPPQAAPYGNEPISPPPYTPVADTSSAMPTIQDPDGIPVDKPGMNFPDGDAMAHAPPTESKKELD